MRTIEGFHNSIAFMEKCGGDCGKCMICRHCTVIQVTDGRKETVLCVYCGSDPEVQPLCEDINDLWDITVKALYFAAGAASRAAQTSGGRG